MPRHPEILEACQDHGLILGKTLIENAGWRTRGSDVFTPKGSVNHHTAGPRTGDLPTLSTLINGRSDLPGPLCNGALSRSGVIYLIAAGRANHAGLGGWQGLSGNSSVFGLEIEHCGYADEPMSERQWDAVYRWHAACMQVCGQTDAHLCCQHFEWAPTRKIDFVKELIATQGGVDGFRSKVLAKMSKGDDDVAYVPYLCFQFVKDDGATPLDGKVWLVDSGYQTRRHIKDSTELSGALFLNKIAGGPGEVYKAKVGDSLGRMVTQATDLGTLVNEAELAAALAKVPAAVVAALPPSSGGGLTPEQVEVACEKAIKDSGLLGLLPGQ